MSNYQLTSSGRDARVKSYRFSTTDRNDPQITALKDQIKRRNAEIRKVNERIIGYIRHGKTRPTKVAGSWVNVPYTLDDINDTYRVRMMGRGPRKSIQREARYQGYMCDLNTYLPLEFAASFDVYVNHNVNKEAERAARRLGYANIWEANNAIAAKWNVIIQPK